eukprot:3472428-Prymnesium_polylepis.1
MYGVWHADGMRDRQTGHGGNTAAEPRYVCCSRGLGLLTSPVDVESQRPETTMGFHKKRFRVRDHLRDITRHHAIVVT